jgi:glycolate oxidase
MKVLKDNADLDLPDANSIILVETDAYTETDSSYQMNRVIEAFRKNRATDIKQAESGSEAEKLWLARKSIGSAAGQLGTNNLSEDVTVPISRVPELLMGISKIVRKYKLPFVIFGHAGDGNLHPKIMYNRYDPEQVHSVHKAANEIFKLTCDLDGTISGEHGVGLAKAPYMELEHDQVALDVMRALKKLLDPNTILNPGKMKLDP